MNIRYILTARGNVKKIDLDNEKDKIYYYHYKDNPFLADYEQEDCIIKESDSLKDICDYFYVDVKNYPYEEDFNLLLNDSRGIKSFIQHMIDYAKRYLDKDLPTWEDVMKEVDSFEFNVYGVVKTNRGLIYVAKLNDEEEWELI